MDKGPSACREPSSSSAIAICAAALRWLARIALLPVGLVAAAATAAEHTFSFTIDLDRDAATGCFVPTGELTFARSGLTRIVPRLAANDGAASGKGHVAVTVARAATAQLLRGPPGDPANSHIPDIAVPDVSPAEVGRDTRPNGTGRLTSRIRILLQITDAATVSSANTLLQAIDATIIGTMQDIKLIVVNIRDTGDFTGLDNALAVLQSSPLIYLAVQDVALA